MPTVTPTATPIDTMTTTPATAKHSIRLTLSPPIPLRLYTLQYWSNPPFFIFDIRALWRSGLSARGPECEKLKMMGQTSMALDRSNNSNLEQLALKGLMRLSAKSTVF